MAIPPVGMGGFSPNLEMELNHREVLKSEPMHRQQEARRESERTGEPQVVTHQDRSGEVHSEIFVHGMFMG